MAFALTMFLQRGFSEVSVSFLFSSASSSGVSFGAFFWSSPQKPMTIFLQNPGSSSNPGIKAKAFLFQIHKTERKKNTANSNTFLKQLKPKNIFSANTKIKLKYHHDIKCKLLVLSTFYFQFIILLLNPNIWFNVHSFLSTIPQTPAQSVQLVKLNMCEKEISINLEKV